MPRGTLFHASCVALDGKGVLILGASGSGKSTLALQLMAYGAGLVSDDRTWLRAVEGQLVASAPTTIRGLIEARGVGILQADPLEPCAVALAVDMDQTEVERLPQPWEFSHGGGSVPLLRRVDHAHFAAAILQVLKGGRRH